MTTDKEQYFCQSCLAVVSLNTTGRCEACNNDSVVPMAAIQAIATQLEAAPKSKPLSQSSPLRQRYWYHLRYECFETVVGPLKASTLEEALRYAMGPFCEWYLTQQSLTDASFDAMSIQGTVLDHQGFNKWCRKRWPLDDVSTEESTSYGASASAQA